MKTPVALSTLLLCLCAGAAAAQNVAAPVVRPVDRVQPVEQVDAVAPVQDADRVDPAVVDPQGTIARLQQQNRDLRAKNEELKGDLAELRAQIREMSTPGGSAVHAYCASDTQSRNTAGAVDECGIYTCNQTSGLCRDRCTNSNHCGPGTACDIESGTCQYPPRE